MSLGVSPRDLQSRSLHQSVTGTLHEHLQIAEAEMSSERTVFFDPTTLAMLRNVLDDAWSRLPAGQTEVTRSLLAQRILRAAKAGELDPARLRARAIATLVDLRQQRR
jgi:hypothetical protein